MTSDHRDLAIETLTRDVLDLEDRVADLEADANINKQLVREAVTMLHDAQKREKQQKTQIAGLIDELRRLRGHHQLRKVA